MATKAKKQTTGKTQPALTVAERKLLRKLLAKADAEDALPVIETPRMKDGGVKRKGNVTRPFWTDGTHAYLRRKRANSEIARRTDERVKKGEYVHVKTTDDVEVYEIADWSSLRRRRLNLSEMPIKRIEREIVQAACAGDWKLYYDAVAEYAHRCKAADLPPATAQLMLQTQMRYLESRIMRRGGPSPMKIAQELKGIRTARTGTQIYLPH